MKRPRPTRSTDGTFDALDGINADDIDITSVFGGPVPGHVDRIGAHFAPRLQSGGLVRTASIVPQGTLSLLGAMLRKKQDNRKAKDTFRTENSLGRLCQASFDDENDEHNDEDDEEVIVSGTPITFNVLSAAFIDGYREVYLPGSCKRSIAETDLRCSFNFQSDMILGRDSAGTLVTYETSDCLIFETNPPRTSWGNDLLVSISRGDVSQAAARLFVLKSHLETYRGETIRLIEEVGLSQLAVSSWGAFHSSVRIIGKDTTDSAMAAGMTYLPALRTEGRQQ